MVLSHSVDIRRVQKAIHGAILIMKQFYLANPEFILNLDSILTNPVKGSGPSCALEDSYRVKVIPPPRHFSLLDSDDGNEAIVVWATSLS
jgi:hypothetical protein